MDCKSCVETRKQADEKCDDKYYAEMAVAALERTNRRFFIVVIILIVLFTVAVSALIWYVSQTETVEITAEQQADGDSNNYAIGGDVYGFPAKGNDQETLP